MKRIFIIGAVVVLLIAVICGICGNAGATESVLTVPSETDFRSLVSSVMPDNWPNNVQNENYTAHSEISVCSAGCDYTNIQAAINGSVDGNRILVHEGRYPESLMINKSLDIRGDGQVIVGDPSGSCVISTTADRVSLRNMTFTSAEKTAVNIGGNMTLLYQLNITAQDPEDPLSPVISGNNNSIIIISKNKITTTGTMGIEFVNATCVFIVDNEITLSPDNKQTGIKFSHKAVDSPAKLLIIENNRIHNGGIVVSPEPGKGGCPEMDNIRINNNTISKSKFWGIMVDALEDDHFYLTNFTIRDNLITSAESHYTNLHLGNIMSGEIVNNTVRDFPVHGEGIKLENLQHMLIQNNSVSDGTVNPLYGWMGFSVNEVRDSIIRNNTLKNVHPYGFSYSPGINRTPNLTFDVTNTHEGRPVFYQEQKSDFIIDNSDDIAMIVLLSCDNGTIRNSTVQNSGLGIGIYNGTDIQVIDNNLRDVNNGIMLIDSVRTEISGNDFNGSWFGIGLGTNYDAEISGNHFSNYSDAGMVLHSGMGTAFVHVTNNSFTGYYPGKEQAIAIIEASGKSMLIANNSIVNNTRGMLLESAVNFTLRDNLIQDGGIGFNLLGAKMNSFISNRILNDDEYSEGFYVISSENSDGGDISRDNTFLNNYVLSTKPVNISTVTNLGSSEEYTWDENQWGVFVPEEMSRDSEDDTYPNVWNRTKTPGSNIVNGTYLGGNYYATPAGTGWSQVHPDRGDGFVSEPYIFNKDNVDYLPLHLPVTPTPTPTPSPTPTPGQLSANFTASPVTGNPPIRVEFIDTSSGNPMSWNWTFGDGAMSHKQNPEHVYSGIGRYTVSLEVSNKKDQSAIRKDSYIALQADWLTGPSGGIWVTSDPEGANVYAEDHLLGITPLEYAGISAGSHQILVSYEGYRNWTGTIQVKQGIFTLVPRVILKKDTS